MKKKEPVKISLPLFITIIVLLVACVAGILMFMQNQKLDEEIASLKEQISKTQTEKNEVQEKLNSVSMIANTINDNKVINETETETATATEDKVTANKSTNMSIPESNTNFSEFEKQWIDNFNGLWITPDEDSILAIDYGKRFCYINKEDNTKEYGTFIITNTISEDSGPTIKLTYNSGKIEELKYAEGSSKYLGSQNKNYVEIDAHYFGESEGDEGIFTN